MNLSIIIFVCVLFVICIAFVFIDWEKFFGYVEFKEDFKFNRQKTGAEIADLFNIIGAILKENYKNGFTSMISSNHRYWTISFQCGKFVCFVHCIDGRTVFNDEKAYTGISLVAPKCIDAPWECYFIHEQKQFLEEIKNLISLSLIKKNK